VIVHFASQRHKVTGIDFLDVPIQWAKRKAEERGVPATLLVNGALTLKDWPERFDVVIGTTPPTLKPTHPACRYIAGCHERPGGCL
jgi:hypothetical protein